MSSILSSTLLQLKSDPTWQGIPIEVKEEIVQLLDYRSRYRLLVCSKPDKELVETSPRSLEQIEIYLTSTHIDANLSKLHIKRNGNDSVVISKNIIEHFFGIFKSKKSIVDSVIFGFNPMDSNQSLAMLSKIETLAKTTKVKAERVYFKTNGVSSDDFLKIFSIFDAKTLKSISFRQIVSKDLVKKLVETDGWKNAKEVFLYGQQDIPIDTVLHLEKMRFSLNNLTAEDAWKLINSFVTKPNIEPGFGFRITYACDLTEQQIVSEFKIAPEVVPNLEHRFSNQHERSYHFRTSTRGIVFVVRMRMSGFGCQDFEAYACSKMDVDEEFRQYGASAPHDHIQVNRRIHNGLPLRNIPRQH